MLPELLDTFSLNDPWAYLGIFLGLSLLIMWRLEAMLDHGLEGTALGTLIMPYCSGLGNLIFVGLMISSRGAPREVLTNCLVNNVTNLTLLLGLPAMIWGLSVVSESGGAKIKVGRGGKAGGGMDGQLNRLSLWLTLVAVVFFSAAVWALGRDGKLDRTDGMMLVGLFLFWQCVQVFDVLKHNVRQRTTLGAMCYVDAVVVLVSAYGLYEAIDWLVAWLTAQKSGFLSGANLGWVTGWLMVLPNAVLALYWGWKRRADIVFSSQVGDGHICIPFGLGLFAIAQPVAITEFFQMGLLLLMGAAGVHALLLLVAGGVPRWAGVALTGVYGWFVWQGLGS